MITATAPALARPNRRAAGRRARPFVLSAAALLLATGVVGFLGDVDDHTQGLGAVSETLAGLSFLAGALALVLLRPVTGWRAMLWWLAPVGMTISGLSMLAVPVTGSEPPAWLFVAGVLPTAIGLVAAGVLGIGRRWRWWTGVGLALLLPMMFLLPLNTLWMSLVWLSVAFSTAPRGRRSDIQSSDPQGPDRLTA